MIKTKVTKENFNYIKEEISKFLKKKIKYIDSEGNKIVLVNPKIEYHEKNELDELKGITPILTINSFSIYNVFYICLGEKIALTNKKLTIFHYDSDNNVNYNLRSIVLIEEDYDNSSKEKAIFKMLTSHLIDRSLGEYSLMKHINSEEEILLFAENIIKSLSELDLDKNISDYELMKLCINDKDFSIFIKIDINKLLNQEEIKFIFKLDINNKLFEDKSILQILYILMENLQS